jgi:hypothetical protein
LQKSAATARTGRHDEDWPILIRCDQSETSTGERGRCQHDDDQDRRFKLKDESQTRTDAPEVMREVAGSLVAKNEVLTR